MRALLWAPGNGLQVVEYDEQSPLLQDGEDFSGVWVSPPLWHDPEGHRLAELDQITIEYVSEAVSHFFLSASNDGGETWVEPVEPNPFPTEEHHIGVEIETAYFTGIQGHDLRFRICFTEPEIIIVMGFIAKMIVRGNVLYRRTRFA